MTPDPNHRDPEADAVSDPASNPGPAPPSNPALPAPPPERARDIGRIAAAARLIEEHYEEPLTIADIAARVGLSRYHFLRLFSATLGMTPYQYLLNRRLRAAARTLRADRRSVLDAALSSGFGDLSEFTRRFRRTFGQTPAAYRGRR